MEVEQDEVRGGGGGGGGGVSVDKVEMGARKQNKKKGKLEPLACASLSRSVQRA